MTIHTEHPFADPQRDPLRAFRGQLVAPVTVWATDGPRGPVGLTVSSLLAVPGEVGRLIGLLDPLSELTESLLENERATVSVLPQSRQGLAEIFAGLAPAPGGRFAATEWGQTQWGPVLGLASTWAGVRLESSRELGYSLEVSCLIEQVEIQAATPPLVHFRGRYPRLG